MSLEFPGIISLQIQVTTKDFESWIHYWTIPLTIQRRARATWEGENARMMSFNAVVWNDHRMEYQLIWIEFVIPFC